MKYIQNKELKRDFIRRLIFLGLVAGAVALPPILYFLIFITKGLFVLAVVFFGVVWCFWEISGTLSGRY